MTKEETQKQIKQMASRALWFGMFVGVVLGFAFGFAVGYGQGSSTTVVVPLSQGIRT